MSMSTHDVDVKETRSHLPCEGATRLVISGQWSGQWNEWSCCWTRLYEPADPALGYPTSFSNFCAVQNAARSGGTLGSHAKTALAMHTSTSHHSPIVH